MCKSACRPIGKAAAEAFLEAYHVKETHAGGVRGSEVTAQYDVFGDTVTRFIHTIGSPNPRVDPPQTEQQLLERMWVRGSENEEIPRVPEGMTARDFYAEHLKRTLGEAYGQDFSHYPTCMTLDSIEYFLFPNAFFFPGTLPAHGVQIPSRRARSRLLHLRSLDASSHTSARQGAASSSAD